MYYKTLLSIFFSILIISACSTKGKEQSTNEKVEIVKKPFGKTAAGEQVDQYTLTNTNGLEMKVITRGGVITSLKTPDKNGKMGDIVLGFDNMDSYNKRNPYFGALIGRYGNRIAKGKFTLDGKEYQLATNNGVNHLHGGKQGFDKVFWKAKEIKNDQGVGLELSYVSKDMEEGYPGNLQATVTYLLTNDNTLEITYQATTDKKTIVNLTQHNYFNLSADPSQSILDHELLVNASRFVPVDETLIPTGELRKVENTPFDFTTPKPVGQDIDAEDEQLVYGKGYDHCWVLDRKGEGLQKAVKLVHPASGRVMVVYTTEPGIQVYSGNFLNGNIKGKNNISYNKNAAICMEPEHFPDSPNQPDFPSVVLDPGQEYTSKTVFKFLVE